MIRKCGRAGLWATWAVILPLYSTIGRELNLRGSTDENSPAYLAAPVPLDGDRITARVASRTSSVGETVRACLS